MCIATSLQQKQTTVCACKGYPIALEYDGAMRESDRDEKKQAQQKRSDNRQHRQTRNFTVLCSADQAFHSAVFDKCLCGSLHIHEHLFLARMVQ